MKLGKKKLQELKENKIQIEDLNDRYFISSEYALEVENISKLLNKNACNFKELIDKFKSIKDEDNDSSLYILLKDEELFKELTENTKLNTEDLRYLLSTIDNVDELSELRYNTFLLKHMIDSKIVSFQELIDKYKSVKNTLYNSCLSYLLRNKDLFKGLIENNKLTIDDLKYLLNEIDKDYELYRLCENTSLIKKILNEFVLDKERVDKFNKWIEKDTSNWYKVRNIYDVFDYIEYKQKRNEENLDQESLELNTLNRKVYQYRILNFDFNKDQKLELIEILKNNDIALNRLKEIVDNNLKHTFDFDALKVYLNKPEKKNILNI